MQVKFRHGAGLIQAEIQADGSKHRAVVDGREYAVEASYLDDHTLLLEIDGERHTVHLARRGQERFVALHGEVHRLVPATDDSDHDLSRLAEPEIRAPMPGKVLQVLVTPGASIQSGDGLLLLEAMKMENRLIAPADAMVEEVRVEAGQMVDAGQVLLVLRYTPTAGES